LTVTAETPTVSLTEAAAVEGSSTTLVCTTPSVITGAAVTYKWYRDSTTTTPISGEIAMQYTFTVAFNSADNYQCSVVLVGTESALSSAFALVGKSGPTLIFWCMLHCIGH
jgi:hypothetical protein